MGYKVTVVGVGPGSPDYLTPEARRAILSASVLVGSARLLAEHGNFGCESRVVDKDVEGALDFIEKRSKRQEVVVLVSGDPGFHSLLSAVRKRIPAERLTVIPGISSIQLAFARLALPWQEADLISMHGRSVTHGKLQHAAGRTLALLTDPSHAPADIAKLLLAGDWPETAGVWLCARLSYPDERIAGMALSEVGQAVGFETSVMVVMA